MKAIAAMAENGLMGNDNGLPWHIPDEFKWFRQTTMGGVLLMGSKTLQTLPKKLPGRSIYVLSRSDDLSAFPMADGIVHSIDEILALEKNIPVNQSLWIAGGAEVYKLCLSHCSELILSVIKGQYEGNVYFPEYQSFFNNKEVLHEAAQFTVYRYSR